MEEAKILISFTRPKYSNETCAYLCSKLDKEEDAKIIRNISLLTSGQKKALQVKEANIVPHYSQPKRQSNVTLNVSPFN